MSPGVQCAALHTRTEAHMNVLETRRMRGARREKVVGECSDILPLAQGA